MGCNFSMDCCSNTRFSLEGEKNASGHLWTVCPGVGVHTLHTEVAGTSPVPHLNTLARERWSVVVFSPSPSTAGFFFLSEVNVFSYKPLSLGEPLRLLRLRGVQARSTCSAVQRQPESAGDSLADRAVCCTVSWGPGCGGHRGTGCTVHWVSGCSGRQKTGCPGHRVSV